MGREQRKLAAIVAADVVGYSRLMGRDESGTLAALKALRREVVDPKIDAYNGRIVKTTGDGLLLEFPSVVDAVRCVIEVQTELATRSTGVPEDRRITFRVGVNLGDVIVDGDDIFGDGVNVAARLEAISEPGGACLSDDVVRQVRGKVAAIFDSMGSQSLKNSDQPVDAWRWLPARASSVIASAPVLPLPDKPSIAVLPFQNMSGDPEQQYFADGMVEEIITALSRFKSLFVIARNSSFSYKGKSPVIRQVGNELGVRYVLEGSVRKAGNRVRITGQLIDSVDGTHIWADRFEGQIEDVFDLQDQVTSNVVASILPYVERAEIARTRDKPTASLVAYDHYLRGLDCGAQFTRQSNEEALGHYQRAIAEDPKYALAYVRAAICLLNRRAQGWLIGDPALEAPEAMRLARKALTFDRADPQVLANAASVFQYLGGNYDEGQGLVRLSVELNPNYFSGWNIRGWIALGSGDRGAYDYFQHAIRLSPRHPRRFNIQAGLAAAEFFRGNYEEAVKLTTTALLQRPNYLVAMWVQAAAPALLGRNDEASASCRSILEIVPNAHVSMLDNWVVSKRPEILDTFREGLRRSGVPE